MTLYCSSGTACQRPLRLAPGIYSPAQSVAWWGEQTVTVQISNFLWLKSLTFSSESARATPVSSLLNPAERVLVEPARRVYRAWLSGVPINCNLFLQVTTRPCAPLPPHTMFDAATVIVSGTLAGTMPQLSALLLPVHRGGTVEG